MSSYIREAAQLAYSYKDTAVSCIPVVGTAIVAKKEYHKKTDDLHSRQKRIKNIVKNMKEKMESGVDVSKGGVKARKMNPQELQEISQTIARAENTSQSLERQISNVGVNSAIQGVNSALYSAMDLAVPGSGWAASGIVTVASAVHERATGLAANEENEPSSLVNFLRGTAVAAGLAFATGYVFSHLEPISEGVHNLAQRLRTY
jgi:hypothetical protein